MKNNVYVRSNRSIKTISMTRMILLIPLILYGIYKSGIYLYTHSYTNILGLFKPIILIIGSMLIGALVNIIYKYVFKHSKDDLISVLFSSFHIEYGLIISCLIPININIYMYFIVLFIILFISKFIRNRVNIICLIMIIIYILQDKLFGGFTYLNNYEASTNLSLRFMDYLIGRGPGGLASTHIILLCISFIGMYITNNNKSNITISSVITLCLLFAFYATFKHISYSSLILTNNLLFIMTYVATDTYTSSYTIKGEIIFGILVSILTFILYFINPILSPYIAILIVSLFNIVIDKYSRMLNKI